jgi:hypothetical protein
LGGGDVASDYRPVARGDAEYVDLREEGREAGLDRLHHDRGRDPRGTPQRLHGGVRPLMGKPEICFA